MGKKRKNVPSLQDLLDRPICYYCERDFEDMSYLVDHMKAKHYKCGRCSRRLTTAGGLGVHMKQVHKEELTKIENAMKEREKPDVEVFGMEGFPPKLLETIKTRVTNEFFKNEQKQRQETGNPPRGTQPVASNPQKQETIEEMKARLAAHKAQKATEKAAAANGLVSGNNTPPVNNDAVATPQDAAMAQNYPKPGTITYDASGNKNLEIGALDYNKSPIRGYDVKPMQPYPQPSNVMLPQSTYATPTTTMSSPMYPPSYTSMTSRGPNPATMASYPPRPSAGMSGSPPPSFSYGAPPPGPPLAAHRQNSLPSAPGLPQRPAFDSPNVSKEDMAKMHVGTGSAPPGLPMHYNGQMSAGSYAPVPPPNGPPYPQYGNPNASYPGYPTNLPPAPQASDYVIDTQGDPSLHGLGQSMPQQPQNIPSEDDIDALIRSVTGEQPQSRPAVDTLPVGQPALQGKMTDTAGSDSERLSPHGSVSTNEPLQETMTQKQKQIQAQAQAQGQAQAAARAQAPAQAQPPVVVTEVAMGASPGGMSTQSQHLDTHIQGTDTAQASSISSNQRTNSSEISKIGSDVPIMNASVPARSKLKNSETTLKPTVSAKKKSSAPATTLLIYSHTAFSPEELYAGVFQTRKNRKTETVLDQPGEDGQEVTGPVDDSLES